MARWKILSGVHSVGGQTFVPPAEFDDPSDLRKLDPHGERFARVGSDPQETHAAAMEGAKELLTEQRKVDGLDEMTVEQLRQFATESEVDLGKARTKDQILAVLRSA
jgi:hypothetical protein